MTASCEEPIVFACDSSRLVGMISLPGQGLPAPRIGVLIVVGGPQYRVGSHRQFIHLARVLASHGVACMRFDYRGMGDSEGAARDFENVSKDIRAAVDAFFTRVPSIGFLALWGLCDGATACSFYAPTDGRVRGLVLVNPWVRTQAGEARAVVRTYYRRRLLEADFWAKLFRGRVSLLSSAGDLVRNVATGFMARRAQAMEPGASARDAKLPLPARMARCLGDFSGKVLVVLSGNDLTAAEFKNCAVEDETLGRTLRRLGTEWLRVDKANHTFSSSAWKAELAVATLSWLGRHFGENLAKEAKHVQFLQE